MTLTDSTDILCNIVVRRFKEEQPERKLTKSELDGIWYAIHGRLCRGESEETVKAWCETVPLNKEKPVHRHMRVGAY